MVLDIWWTIYWPSDTIEEPRAWWALQQYQKWYYFFRGGREYKIRIRIFRIGCWHVMNNILAFGPYWRAESLVGTTISQMMILLSRWRRIQTSKNGCDFDTLTAFMAWQLCFFCILHIQALQSNTSFYVSHQEVHPRLS